MVYTDYQGITFQDYLYCCTSSEGKYVYIVSNQTPPPQMCCMQGLYVCDSLSHTQHMYIPSHTQCHVHMFTSLYVVQTCVYWKLIGRCVWLTEADLTVAAVDGDNNQDSGGEESRDADQFYASCELTDYITIRGTGAHVHTHTGTTHSLHSPPLHVCSLQCTMSHGHLSFHNLQCHVGLLHVNSDPSHVPIPDRLCWMIFSLLLTQPNIACKFYHYLSTMLQVPSINVQ